MPGVAGLPKLTIVCCSDSTTRALRGMSDLIRAHEPDVVLFAGDVRAEGSGIGALRAWRWRRAWDGLAARVVAVPGNHDYAPGSDRPWRWRGHIATSRRSITVSPTGAFVLRRDGVRILGFDCGPCAARVPDEQIEWVRGELRRDDDGTHRIAVCHAPPFPVSEHIGSSLDADPAGRDSLWECLEDCGVRLVICGHEHLYARRTVDRQAPITQIITGGGGAQSNVLLSADVHASAAVPHIVVLHVHSASVEGVAVGRNGLVLDRFTVPALADRVGAPG